jgi:hypothetical protein
MGGTLTALRGDAKNERLFPGTMQSETPVPPKGDFETRGPKTAESGRDIVSTVGAKNASLIRLGKEAIIRPRENESRM